MPVDALFLSALTAELNGAIIGARVDKIHQPSESEVLFSLRGAGGTHKLLISAGGGVPRIHLTAIPYENPQSAPMFCMLLRKYLTSARLRAVRQVPFERIVELEWDTQDEMGVPSVKRLIAELMGRNSNLALVAEDGRVLDCIRRTGLESPRPIQAGLFYKAPDAPDKTDPLGVTPGEFDRLFSEYAALHAYQTAPSDINRVHEEFLIDTFSGISPILAREIALDGEEMPERFFRYAEDARQGRLQPYIFTQNGIPKEFYCFGLNQYGKLYEASRFDGGFSELLDAVCGERERAARLNQKVASLRKTAQNNCRRIRKKILLQEQTVEESLQRERFRRYGDLLMANLHRAAEARGKKSIEVEDFYGEAGEKAQIELDETKNLQQNAAQYYVRYRKLKNAEAMTKAQLSASRGELEYWESVAEELSRVTCQRDIDEIREELAPPTPARKQGAKPGKQRKKAAEPQRFISSAGIPFRAGRNNRQNDELTMRAAGKGDIWLHAQKIPGCHVVIDASGGMPDEQTLLEAAAVAAVYSQASESTKVAVDYTRVKHVKKPPGAKPGMVIYSEFKTVLVRPDKELAQRLADNAR
ncbi:MAG: NFACT family protein [Oscillospiraceae bacterium]|jgi:predicted ribosome quality control (RQC) complex YloA/Tae2 family protein|nr:NFACT family protein [Oscillospiraceae bacterium]